MISVYALCGGYIDLDLSGFFCDKAPGSRATVPVICFLIAHPQGNVLLDTGVHRQALTDPVEPARPARAHSRPGPLRGQLALSLRSLRGQRVLPALHFPRPAAGDGGGPPGAGGSDHALQPKPHRLRPSSGLPAPRWRARHLRRRPGGDHPDLRAHAGAPVGAGARGQGHGSRPRRGRLLHAGEHGPRRAAQHALGSRGDVAVAGHAAGTQGSAGGHDDLRPRRRPVAGDAEGARAARGSDG